METKQWWKSKTILAGVAAVVIGGYNAGAPQFGWPPIPDWVFALLGGVGIYGRIDAKTKIG